MDNDKDKFHLTAMYILIIIIIPCIYIIFLINFKIFLTVLTHLHSTELIMWIRILIIIIFPYIYTFVLINLILSKVSDGHPLDWPLIP